MGLTASYKVWITITAAHGYFPGKQCGLGILPTAETGRSFRKMGLLIRQYDPCTWLLCQSTHTARSLAEEEVSLVFDLKALAPDFYYFTENKIALAGNVLSEANDINKYGVWKQLTLQVTEKSLSSEQDIRIDLFAKPKYWEFILIPKFRSLGTSLKLREEKEQITFQWSEVQFPGFAKPVVRFLSKEALALSADYPYKVRLVQQIGEVESFVRTRLPLPKPASASLFSSKDTISSYIYF